MRAIVTAIFVAAAFVGTAAAQAPGDQGAGAFPRDADSLRELDSQQLRILHRASSQCWHSGQGGFRSASPQSRACIISLAENAVKSADSPELLAFHNALPMHARYDENRPAYYWQRFLQR